MNGRNSARESAVRAQADGSFHVDPGHAERSEVIALARRLPEEIESQVLLGCHRRAGHPEQRDDGHDDHAGP